MDAGCKIGGCKTPPKGGGFCLTPEFFTLGISAMQNQFCTHMICTTCNKKMLVLDSRTRHDGRTRRYRCERCQRRRSTVEVDLDRWERAKRALDMLVDLRQKIEQTLYR